MRRLERWRDIPRGKPIYLYGAGRAGQLVYAGLIRRRHTVAAFIDAEKTGELDGVSILTPDAFAACWRPGDLVLIASQFHREIAARLVELAGRTEQGSALTAGIANAYPLFQGATHPGAPWRDLLILSGGLLRFAGAIALRMAGRVLRTGRGRGAAPDHPLAIRHCPTSVGGNPQVLAMAERAEGHDSCSVITQQNYFNYPGAEILFRPDDGPAERELKRLAYLSRLVDEADVVHFNFGQSLMMPCPPAPPPAAPLSARLWHRLCSLYSGPDRAVDLPLLRWFGKAICVTYQGDDARLGAYCRANFPINHAHYVDPGYYDPEQEALKVKGIARMARYADRLYALNPDLLHTLPAGTQFMPYACDMVSRNEPDPPANEGRPLRIVHAPTHRIVKGTSFLLAAVERLHAEGVPFEFELVEGLSHDEALERYRTADLLVDQLLCGWIGVLSVEFMALGKPVICYIREGDRRFLPPGMDRDLPVICADPGNIYEVLKYWLTDGRPELPDVGRKSREFARTWFDVRTIAQGLIRDYRSILATPRTSRFRLGNRVADRGRE